MLQKHFYKKVTSLLPFLFSLTLLSLSGCNESDKREKTAPVIVDRETAPIEESILMETLDLVGIDNMSHKLTISPKKLTFHDIDQPVVVVHLFKSFDLDTRYLLQTLSSLQEKQRENLFVASLQIGDGIDPESLQSFVQKQKLTQFVSNDTKNQHFKPLLYESLSLGKERGLPLTIIYSDGEYTIHYGGAIPIEMLSYDIDQAIQD